MRTSTLHALYFSAFIPCQQGAGISKHSFTPDTHHVRVCKPRQSYARACSLRALTWQIECMSESERSRRARVPFSSAANVCASGNDGKLVQTPAAYCAWQEVRVQAQSRPTWRAAGFAACGDTCRARAGATVCTGGVLQRLHAEQLHFWCHLFYRYVAFLACCAASGHTSAFFAQGDQNAAVETSIFAVYSVLYLAHICALCSRRDKRLCACVVRGAQMSRRIKTHRRRKRCRRR